MRGLKAAFYFGMAVALSQPAYSATAVGTETILTRYFGVNLHLDNCCRGNYADVNTVISRLKYIGARRVRDWATGDALVNTWNTVYKATGVKFHAPIPQMTPTEQRNALTRIANWAKTYPGLIDVIEGTNEPDTDYPLSLGASLADSANLQYDVYRAGTGLGVKVSQLSVGAGWYAPLWEGNYKNFGKPPADYGNSHAYMTSGVPAASTLKRIGDLAAWSVDGKPVDVTEFGTYQANMDDLTASAYMHLAPFDAYLLGYVGLSVYALHDDMTNVVSFYKSDGTKRPIADYWHYTAQLLTDTGGKNLPVRDINITFSNQVSTGTGVLGIKNVLMYKSDGSTWIASYDEERAGAADASQRVTLDKVYDIVTIYDGRNGATIKTYNKISSFDMTMKPNYLYLVQAIPVATTTTSTSTSSTTTSSTSTTTTSPTTTTTSGTTSTSTSPTDTTSTSTTSGGGGSASGGSGTTTTSTGTTSTGSTSTTTTSTGTLSTSSTDPVASSKPVKRTRIRY